MKLVRFISTILFYLARTLAIGYLVTAFYMFISVVFKLESFRLLEHNRFAVCYPFTDKNFLLGSEYTFAYVTEMVLIIAFYGMFFWLLGSVFQTFRHKPLFTKKGIINLQAFGIIT